MKVNTPLVGASWAALAIVTPPLSRSTLHLLPHSVTCDGCAQYLHCLHAGVWWCRRGNRGCADPCCQYSLFTVSYISCGTVLMKHSGEGISSCFAFFFFFLEASLWQGKTPAGWRGFAERAGTAVQLNLSFVRTDVLPENKNCIIGWT